jgi:hypothetical protein
MSRKLAAVSVLGVVVSVVLLTGCPPHKSIAEIQRDPGKYSNKEVTIGGNVVSTFGALGTGMYQLDDGTGRMWVISENYGVPSKGAKVAVVGRVMDTFSFGGRSYSTVLRQTQRRK